MKKDKKRLKEFNDYLHGLIDIFIIAFSSMCFNVGFLIYLFLMDYPKTMLTIMFSMAVSSLLTMILTLYISKKKQ